MPTNRSSGFSRRILLHIEVDEGVYMNLFSPLWSVDPQGRFVPELATEVPTSANGGISPNGLIWRSKAARRWTRPRACRSIGAYRRSSGMICHSCRCFSTRLSKASKPGSSATRRT
jgi:hypothetical protein